MCIRDSINAEYMGTVIFVILALAAANALQTVNIAEPFVNGLYKAFEITPNSNNLKGIRKSNLNSTKISIALKEITSFWSQALRLRGVILLHTLMYEYDRFQVCKADVDDTFIKIFKDTISALGGGRDFIAKAERYNEEKKVDIFEIYNQANKAAKAGDFEKVGERIGKIVVLLRDYKPRRLVLNELKEKARSVVKRIERYIRKTTI
eukprot:TRINITY_DN3037_c0_g2_i3.p1 TRINITY_DN3037_c0_g2~~TRINITY_DN3037_c0_g2_i3.p1  ORF type:complete len:207 (+),score=78.41 TRINITY_DN3037_c0_g2_i3:77-697(+)